VYSASSGGFSEANEVVWDNEPSESLRPRLDGLKGDPALAKFAKGLDDSNIREWVESYPPTFSARSSFSRSNKYRWKVTYTAEQLDRFVAPLGVGGVLKLEILGRGTGGRVTGLRVVGSKGIKQVLRELPVRRMFGNLNSGMFVLDETRSPEGDLVSVTFTGGGWGHGVGMCQMGAIGRAEAKQTFRQILAHYYNGAQVERIY
jgi:SpoIID/LytB domain protein